MRLLRAVSEVTLLPLLLLLLLLQRWEEPLPLPLRQRCAAAEGRQVECARSDDAQSVAHGEVVRGRKEDAKAQGKERSGARR
jgi:hypothetical protein